MIEILFVFFASIVTENAVFAHLYGVSPFIKICGKIKSALVFGLFITVAGVISSACFHFISRYFLEKAGIEYIGFFVYALICSALIQLLSLLLKKTDVKLYLRMRDVLPLAAVNTVIIGAALALSAGEKGLGILLISDLAYSIGFIIAVLAFCSVIQRLSIAEPPKAFKGMPATFIALGLVIMAFYGLTGLSFGDSVTTSFLRFKM